MSKKKTNQEFLQELAVKVPDYKTRYPNLSPYISQQTNLTFDYKYGKCSMSPFSIKCGNLPTIKVACNKTLFFQNLIFDKRPEIKTYIKGFLNYRASNAYIDVLTYRGLCRMTPGTLLNRQGSLPSIKAAVNKTQYFKMMMREKFPDYIFDFIIVGEYIDWYTKIKIFTTNGYCEMMVSNLLAGKKPNIRSAICKTTYFINVVNKIHNFKYDYTDSVYKYDEGNLIINCPIHGDFKQTPNTHIHGGGCMTCGLEVSGYDNWLSGCQKKGNRAIFYIIRCWNDIEEFYKVGVTRQTMDKRFASKNQLPYNYEIVQTISGTCQKVWDFEHYIKRELNRLNLHYSPKIYFGGSITECFKLKK